MKYIFTGIFVFFIVGMSSCTMQQSVSPTAVPTPAVTSEITPSESPTASPSPTIKPTSRPTAKATISGTAKPVITSKPTSAIRFEPSSIKVSKKRSELDSLPAVHVYYPGTHQVIIQPADGTVGIWGSILPNTTSADGSITDVGLVKLHFSDAYERGIKSGVNKETLQLKEGSFVEALGKQPIASLTVEITITD